MRNVSLPVGPFLELTELARARSLKAAMGERPQGPLYVFAYGSLLWRPCFEPISTRRARLSGYARQFSMWTVKARGTPHAPGLGLALERCNGECGGVLLEVSHADENAALKRLWAREMLTAAYVPTWVHVFVSDQRHRQRGTPPPKTPITALTFVIDPGHPQYAGELTAETQAKFIASASGELGPCADYLVDTVSALREHDLADDELERLLRHVRDVL
ncbi:MAG: cation transport protein ChaC [Gammaproteobacteria bacterium]|jgi:cation transport protein ChaC